MPSEKTDKAIEFEASPILKELVTDLYQQLHELGETNQQIFELWVKIFEISQILNIPQDLV